MEDIQEYYSALTDSFTGDGPNDYKALQIRKVYESFVKKLDPTPESFPKPTFNERLNHIFDVHNVPNEIKVLSIKIWRKLSYGAIHVEELEDIKKDLPYDKLKICYTSLVIVIMAITGETPDIKTQILSGTCDGPWYVQGLNDQQKAAVMDDSADLVYVNAGPGTGKTFLLVHKMLCYLDSDPKLHVVALSFTNSAASQLKERFQETLEKLGHAKAKYPNCISSTIHSFCYRLLSEYCKHKHIPFDYEIIDESDVHSIAEDIASQYGIIGQESEIEDILKGTSQYGDLLIRKVGEYKRQHHFINVDEILDLFLNACDDNRFDFRKWLKGKVDCLLVDEDQDLTIKIFKVISVIKEEIPSLKMFFVGDPRQNIFSFNGASNKNFKDFLNSQSLYKAEYNLTITYRCPKSVVDRVNPLSFTDCSNPPLEMGDKSNIGSFQVLDCNDQSDEVQKIAEIIRRTNNNSEVCVLSSWLNYLSNVAVALNDKNIPFVVKGGKRSLNESVKIMNYCLRVISSKDVSNVTQRLKRHVRDYEASVLRRFLDEKRSSLRDAENVNLQELITEISEILLRENENLRDSKETLEKYAAMAKPERYGTIEGFLFDCASRKNDDFACFYEFDFPASTASASGAEAVTLSTIHSAKGLEWDNVILAGADDSTLPSYKCFYDGNSQEKIQEMLNDEKKKYYVAVTRCRKNLYITYSKNVMGKYGKSYPRELSRFVSR